MKRISSHKIPCTFPNLNKIPEKTCVLDEVVVVPAVPLEDKDRVFACSVSLRELAKDVLVWLMTTEKPMMVTLWKQWNHRGIELANICLVFEGLSLISVDPEKVIHLHHAAAELLFPYATWGICGSSDDDGMIESDDNATISLNSDDEIFKWD